MLDDLEIVEEAQLKPCGDERWQLEQARLRDDTREECESNGFLPGSGRLREHLSRSADGDAVELPFGSKRDESGACEG
jgi:hypothetical protein